MAAGAGNSSAPMSGYGGQFGGMGQQQGTNQQPQGMSPLNTLGLGQQGQPSQINAQGQPFQQAMAQMAPQGMGQMNPSQAASGKPSNQGGQTMPMQGQGNMQGGKPGGPGGQSMPMQSQMGTNARPLQGQLAASAAQQQAQTGLMQQQALASGVTPIATMPTPQGLASLTGALQSPGASS